MREIKFRGWHVLLKRMFSAQEMAHDQLTLLPTGNFINVSSTHTAMSQIHPQDKFIPLQYTGLKDKNGKEIYGGDIVRSPNTCPHDEDPSFYGYELGRVIFENGAFVVEFFEGKEHVGDIECEIIGNIYENPELLKEAANA